MLQTALDFTYSPYPDLGYKPGTQLDRVYRALQRGEVSGREFLRMFIPEYRSRLNEISHDLATHGLFIQRRRIGNDRFIIYSIGGIE